MAAIGLGLIAGYRVRLFALGAALVLAYYMVIKLGAASSMLGYFNSVKRELALFAAGLVLARLGGGSWYTPSALGAAAPDWLKTALGWAGAKAGAAAAAAARGARARLAARADRLRRAAEDRADAAEAKRAAEVETEEAEPAAEEVEDGRPPASPLLSRGGAERGDAVLPPSSPRPTVYVDPVALKRMMSGERGAPHGVFRRAAPPDEGEALDAAVRAALRKHTVLLGKDGSERSAPRGRRRRAAGDGAS